MSAAPVMRWLGEDGCHQNSHSTPPIILLEATVISAILAEIFVSGSSARLSIHQPPSFDPASCIFSGEQPSFPDVTFALP
jgi:hypothetical protein